MNPYPIEARYKTPPTLVLGFRCKLVFHATLCKAIRLDSIVANQDYQPGKFS